MVEAGRGNIITCNPGEVHDGTPIAGPREWKMLYLDPSLVRSVLIDIREGASAEAEFTNPVIAKSPRVDVFEAAYDALTGSHGVVDSAEERLILLLAGLLHDRPSFPAAPDQRGLVRARSRIDDDPMASIALTDLAREADMSRFQLIRGFARLTGLTPHAYILQRRLHAARMLIATGVTLANAAAACGFADQSHFHRAFVRSYGMTPGSYAKATR